MEEIWNIAKRDLLILKYFPSFADFKNKNIPIFQNKKIGSEYDELSNKECNLENIWG
jgi:hypothetical protein